MNTVPDGAGGVPATDPFVDYDAAYVFGSLAPDERVAYERHLQHCDNCSASVAAMAGIPGLLARVPVEQVTGVDQAPAPLTLLPRLVDEVNRRRVRTRLRTGAVLVLAAACVLGLLVAVLNQRGLTRPGASGPLTTSGASTPASAPTSVTPTPGPELPMTVVGQTGLTAGIRIQSVKWGTRITMRCHEPATATNVPLYTGTYYLVAVDNLGTHRTVATWRGLPGKTVPIEADTELLSKDISSLLVTDTDHDVLLKLDV